MMIPEKLKIPGVNFVLLKKGEKIPFQQGWQKKKIGFNSIELIEHIKAGGNYGVMGGGEAELIIIDFDDEDVQTEAYSKLPKTFTVMTGSGLLHKYYLTNGSESFKIFDEEMNTLADIQGEGKQVVGAGSTHPNGKKYEVVEDEEVVFLAYSEIKAVMMAFDKKPDRQKPKPKNHFNEMDEIEDEFLNKIKKEVSVAEVLSWIRVDSARNPTQCFKHDSKGGKCLGFNHETAHCFHCDGAWNIFSLLMEAKKLSFKECLEFIAEKKGLEEELSEARKKYALEKESEAKVLANKQGFLFNAFSAFSDYLSAAKKFHEQQPFFYDSYKIWWLWNLKYKKWQRVDEIDLLNAIDEYTQLPSTKSVVRGEILESMKRVGRKNKPKDASPKWIQFKEKIYDLETKKIFDATPEYFVTNPIPWKLGESCETPTIDKILKEWVYKEGIQDESYVKTLKEIMSYVMLSCMPLHRIFCFIGEGLNGKGTYLRLINNLVGSDNACATEIEILSANRFESNKLYKKLVCFVGEIDKGIFRKTKTIKSLTGEDTVRVEFKGKDGFDAKNYANPLISTNHLPETNDKTKGFYRRWTIVDFPNMFNEKQNPLDAIPDEEYENFCKQSLDILEELLKKGGFENDGTIAEREDKYEKHSNHINDFIKLYCNPCEEHEHIEFAEFADNYNEFLIGEGMRKKSKIEIGRALSLKGYDKRVKKVTSLYGNSTTKMCIFGIKWKEGMLDLV